MIADEYTIMSGRSFEIILLILVFGVVGETFTRMINDKNQATFNFHTLNHALVLSIIVGVIDWILENQIREINTPLEWLNNIYQHPSFHTFFLWGSGIALFTIFPVKEKRKTIGNYFRIIGIIILGVLIGYNLMVIFNG